MYTDGTEFFGIANAPKSSVRQTADAPSSETSYVITTKKETLLDFYAIVKRVSDGACFRVVSDSGDNMTPVSSPLGIRQYSAEKCAGDGAYASEYRGGKGLYTRH